MSGHLPGMARAPVAVGGQGVQLACAHLDDGELAGDKKAVERDEEADGQQLEKDHAWLVPTRCRASDIGGNADG